MKQLFNIVPIFSRKTMMALLVGALLGVLLLGLVRFVWQPHDTVHYHANFAVFINGQRQDFKGAHYYQEVASCSATANPSGRVHMHDNVGHVVHVHDESVTWGNFFAILGWSLNEQVLFDGRTVYQDGQAGRLRFILNGQPVRSIANEVIANEDRLLISFGDEDATALGKQFDQVAADAARYNQTKDPSACRGPEELTIWRRLQRAFWF